MQEHSDFEELSSDDSDADIDVPNIAKPDQVDADKYFENSRKTVEVKLSKNCIYFT